MVLGQTGLSFALTEDKMETKVENRDPVSKQVEFQGDWQAKAERLQECVCVLLLKNQILRMALRAEIEEPDTSDGIADRMPNAPPNRCNIQHLGLVDVCGIAFQLLPAVDTGVRIAQQLGEPRHREPHPAQAEAELDA